MLLRRIDRALILAPLMLAAPLVHGPAFAQARTAETPLDEVGYATVLDGGSPAAVRGAHRSLPAPSYVEVTALSSGRTILVEIDQQGASSPGEVIALSCGAIRQLGLSALPGAVRVRRVSPPDQERAMLSAGRSAAARLDAPEGLLSALRRKVPPAPPPAGASDCTGQPVRSDPMKELPIAQPPAPAPVALPHSPPPVGEKPRVSAPVQAVKRPGYVIQVAALSSRPRADVLARSVGGHVVGAGAIFRVRTGPYASETAARAALPAIRAKGFADARVMPNEGR